MSEFISSPHLGRVSEVSDLCFDDVAEPTDVELAEIEALSPLTDAEVAVVAAESALLVAVDELAARRALLRAAGQFVASADLDVA